MYLKVGDNLARIKDREYAEKVNKQVDDLELKYRPLAKEIYDKVTEKITR